jgi:hypothetical protein
MGVDLTGGDKWKGSVLAPDGKIYCIPYLATDFLVIDPSTDTAIRTTLGLDFSSAFGWESGVLAFNGKIYCPPNYWNTNFCIIDTKTSTATKETWGVSMVANVQKWRSGVTTGNKKLYFQPSSNDEPLLLIVDIENNTASKIAITTNSRISNGVTIAPDGTVYATYPGSGQAISNVLRFNPNDNTSSYWTLGLNVSTQSILVPSGKIIGFGNDDELTVIDFKKEVPLSLCLSPYLNKL